MLQIIYASAATKPFSTGDLAELLETSRRNNVANSITGMLVYHNGDFLQIFEGPEQAATDLYEAIRRDSRHSNFRLIMFAPVAKRAFKDWSMGFADSREIPPNVEGFADLEAAFADLNETRAKIALGWFARGHWHSVAA